MSELQLVAVFVFGVILGAFFTSCYYGPRSRKTVVKFRDLVRKQQELQVEMLRTIGKQDQELTELRRGRR